MSFYKPKHNIGHYCIVNKKKHFEIVTWRRRRETLSSRNKYSYLISMDKTTPSVYSNDSNNLNDSENECEDDVVVSLDHNGLPCEIEENSFAGDFYRCGTDWSSLNSSTSASGGNDPDKKRLKQCNLLELWKLPSKTNAEASTSTSLLSNKKKMKKSMDDFPRQRDQQQQPRACPFYKKMPGNYVFVE